MSNPLRNSDLYVIFRYDYHGEDHYLEVRWYGGPTFNVYAGSQEVDVFTRYGDDQAGPPSFEQALESVQAYFQRVVEELEEEELEAEGDQ